MKKATEIGIVRKLRVQNVDLVRLTRQLADCAWSWPHSRLHKFVQALKLEYAWAWMKLHCTMLSQCGSVNNANDLRRTLSTWSYTAQFDLTVVSPSKWALFSACLVWTAFAVSVASLVFRQSWINYTRASCIQISSNVEWKLYHTALARYSIVRYHLCSSVFPA